MGMGHLLVLAVLAAGDERVASPDDDQVFRPTTSGPFVTFTAPITPPGRLVVQPILSYAFARGTFDADGVGEPLESGATSHVGALTLFTEFGLRERVTVGTQLSVVHNRVRLEGASQSGTGLADAFVFARMRVLDETARAVPEVTLLGLLKVPSGQAEGTSAKRGTDVFGTGSTEVTLGVDLTKGLRPLLVTRTFSIHARFRPASAARRGSTVTSSRGARRWSGRFFQSDWR